MRAIRIRGRAVRHLIVRQPEPELWWKKADNLFSSSTRWVWDGRPWWCDDSDGWTWRFKSHFTPADMDACQTFCRCEDPRREELWWTLMPDDADYCKVWWVWDGHAAWYCQPPSFNDRRPAVFLPERMDFLPGIVRCTDPRLGVTRPWPTTRALRLRD